MHQPPNPTQYQAKCPGGTQTYTQSYPVYRANLQVAHKVLGDLQLVSVLRAARRALQVWSRDAVSSQLPFAFQCACAAACMRALGALAVQAPRSGSHMGASLRTRLQAQSRATH